MIGRLRHGWENRRGNAVLFSLIIMASAMTISLGMAGLVAGEVRTVGLLPSAERAYYKAEGYIEQALWEKKQNANYQVTDRSQLPATFLCGTANGICFESAPTDQANALEEFFATTSPPTDQLTLERDSPLQLDIDTASANGSGTLELTNLAGEAGFRGLEVTIIAYPRAAAPPLLPNTTTPVFVDKKVVTGNAQTIQLTASQRNPVNDAYPDLNANNLYRLRLRALGSNASVTLRVRSGGRDLTLRSADFTVRSVAEDDEARRGIQVIVPAAEQVASVFDFVLFSDLDLDKLRGKTEGTTTKSVTATVIRDDNKNCLQDGGDVVMANHRVSLEPGYAQLTDTAGTATFTNLQLGYTYQVRPDVPAGMEACAPPGNPQPAAFAPTTANESRQLTFLLRALRTDATITNQVFYLPSDPNTTCAPVTNRQPWPNRPVSVTGQANQLTDAGGTAFFGNLIGGQSYNSTVSVPAGWQICTNLSSPAPGTNPNPPAPAPLARAEDRVNTFVFRPVCQLVDRGTWVWVDTSRWEWQYRGITGGDAHDAPTQPPDHGAWGVEYHEYSGYREDLGKGNYRWWFYVHTWGWVWVTSGYWTYQPNYVWSCPNP